MIQKESGLRAVANPVQTMALDAFRCQTVDAQIIAHLRCFCAPSFKSEYLIVAVESDSRSALLMKYRDISRFSLQKSRFLFCILAALQPAQAQLSGEPERTQLLNGLRVVFLPKPGDQDVLVKLRIHSGAAFDLAGKAGSMALLGDILFPDPSTREYFTEEMQGRLERRNGLRFNHHYDAGPRPRV